MPDNALTAIDEALARAAGRSPLARRAAHPQVQVQVTIEREDEPAVAAKPHILDSPFWAQLFIGIQFLWGVALFLPGAQSIRFAVRALPYVSSIALLAAYLLNRSHRGPLAKGAGWLAAALFLLVLNLLHPSTQPYAGVAQCIFQLSIAAPMFWMHKAVRSSRQLHTLLVLALLMNFAGAAMGILQVYFPDRFMPQFSLQIADELISSMTYIGGDGRRIVRPPGLSDTPGGAAMAGGLTAILALGLLLREKSLFRSLGLAAMAAAGFVVVYLTQARSVLLLTIGAAAVIAVAAVRQGRVARATWLLGTAGVLVMASFVWASAVGGESVESRFLGMKDQGAISAYQANRGEFLSETLGQLLDEYPLGAGLGRWGMMETYFGDPLAPDSHVHVEIQLTGWLLDGGIPMWILYGGALIVSLIAVFQLTGSPLAGIADTAPLVLGIMVFVVGMSMSGPAFNMQLGIMFWTVAAALHGAACFDEEHEPE